MPDSHAALLIIDVQQGFDLISLARNNPQAEANIKRLLEAWRLRSQPVLHVQHLSTEPHSTLRPGQPGVEIKADMRPTAGEPLFQKHVNSAFIGTNLEQYLRDHHITSLVVVGLTTDHCVSTTIRMAANLGFTVYAVADAMATFARTGPDGVHHSAELMHQFALASLHGEFAQVVATADLLA